MEINDVQATLREDVIVAALHRAVISPVTDEEEAMRNAIALGDAVAASFVTNFESVIEELDEDTLDFASLIISSAISGAAVSKNRPMEVNAQRAVNFYISYVKLQAEQLGVAEDIEE